MKVELKIDLEFERHSHPDDVLMQLQMLEKAVAGLQLMLKWEEKVDEKV